MPEVQQCTKCGRNIESGEAFVKFKNPNPNQPPLFFHHRGGGNCYWEYLRDRVLLDVRGMAYLNIDAVRTP